MEESKSLMLLTCPICFGEFIDPIIIQCHHTFCRPCLDQWIRYNEDGRRTFKCPSCKDINRIPANGVCGFQTSFYAVQIRDYLQPRKTYPMCKRHPAEDLRFHCQNCELAICRDCKTLFHEGHRAELVQDVARVMCKTLKDKVDESETEYKAVEDIKREYVEDKNTVNKLKQKALDGIQEQAKEMKSIIDNFSRNLEENVSQLFQPFEEDINNDIIDACKKLQSIIAFRAEVKLLVEEGSDHDIISKYKSLVERCGAVPGEAITSWFHAYRSLEKLESVYHSGLISSRQIESMLGSVEEADETLDKEETLTMSQIDNTTFKQLAERNFARILKGLVNKTN